MSNLSNKIDFALIITVKNANPNGDPLNGNRPRTNYSNFGEISDVCLKRKIRNRLMQEGKSIFVQSDDNKTDEFKSLSERYNAAAKGIKGENELFKAVCEKWLDVRTFGQVFAFKSDKKEGEKGVSIGVRGPVSIQSAFSVDPVNGTSIQITKSVNSEPKEGKSSDTMGMKHRVDFGVYLTYGSMNVELSRKTGFSEEDANDIKFALQTLFRNDASSARPEGSMEVHKLIWWTHNNAYGQYSSAKVHRSLTISKRDCSKDTFEIKDYDFNVEPLEGLSVEIIDGE